MTYENPKDWKVFDLFDYHGGFVKMTSKQSDIGGTDEIYVYADGKITMKGYGESETVFVHAPAPVVAKAMGFLGYVCGRELTESDKARRITVANARDYGEFTIEEIQDALEHTGFRIVRTEGE